VIEAVRIVSILFFVALGLFFTLVSTLGVLRLPDIYSRAHTASQADTLGAGFALAGVAIAVGWNPTSIKTVLLLFFIFVTNPTAAHAISRAADEEGIEAWTTDDGRTDVELAAAAETPAPVTDGGESEDGSGAGTNGSEESAGGEEA
jgi:multicomponent Na+:H+ antiporter subunit G